MHENPVTQLTPAEEDPIVDRWLASLPEFAPRDGLDDAVMCRVYVPAPFWLQAVQSGTRRLFSRQRAWAWVGCLAASSAVAMVVLAWGEGGGGKRRSEARQTTAACRGRAAGAAPAYG